MSKKRRCAEEVEQLRRQNARLANELDRARTALEITGKPDFAGGRGAT